MNSHNQNIHRLITDSSYKREKAESKQVISKLFITNKLIVG